MAREIRELPEFFRAFSRLLDTVEHCSPVLFSRSFRDRLREPLREAIENLQQTAARLEGTELRDDPEDGRRLDEAGLTGRQLELKLGSFSESLMNFDQLGSEENLVETLDFGSTILSSAAGAIPGFGSFAQELVDFLLKEIKKKWRLWGRR